jgi:hypothetical protein
MEEEERSICFVLKIRICVAYDRVDHVFQNLFQSEIVETETYLLRGLRCIHNNPVKASITAMPE